MKFRLKVFVIHLISSATVLGLILGGLYLGWYRWPGWFLTDVSNVVLVMVGVDVVLGPSLTCIVANRSKPRRELARDFGIIIAVQLCALTYGTYSLWNGRPLYYAFSESVLQLVQAYDIDAEQARAGRESNPALAPHWYSLPRWVWAPLPEDGKAREEIVSSAVTGGDDVISMPKYYKPWEDGLTTLRTHLKKPDDVGYFSKNQKAALKIEMKSMGLADDELDAIPLTGRRFMLAVMDTKTLSVRKFLAPK